MQQNQKGEKGSFLMVSCIWTWLLLAVELTVLNRRAVLEAHAFVLVQLINLTEALLASATARIKWGSKTNGSLNICPGYQHLPSSSKHPGTDQLGGPQPLLYCLTSLLLKFLFRFLLWGILTRQTWNTQEWEQIITCAASQNWGQTGWFLSSYWWFTFSLLCTGLTVNHDLNNTICR